MTEERLKEIKGNLKLLCSNTDCFISETAKESLELYNEVIRLREIIEDIGKYTRTFDVLKMPTKQLCMFNDIFLIIEGRKNEVKRLKENNDEENNN